jgi:hypothetical protein
MRRLSLAALLLLAACSVSSTSSPYASASPQVAGCVLPVWWGENIPSPVSVRVHAALLSVPDQTVTDVGLLPPLAQVFGATYDSASKKWLAVGTQQLSPDHMRYAYTMADPAHSEVHVVDVATGADHLAYSGSTVYVVIAFAADAIYLAHDINDRQGVYEKLYRLDPAGGTPQLVAGSEHHLYQYGWTLVSGGAAWGLDFSVQGSTYTYMVMRLDLATGAVTKWLDGPPDRAFLPLGTDAQNRLYATDGLEVWRVAQPGQVARILQPTPTPGALTFGGFAADSGGVWIGGRGGVWRYSTDGVAREFRVGAPQESVIPAGPCT